MALRRSQLYQQREKRQTGEAVESFISLQSRTRIGYLDGYPTDWIIHAWSFLVGVRIITRILPHLDAGSQNQARDQANLNNFLHPMHEHALYHHGEPHSLKRVGEFHDIVLQ